jgi:hypothetical protein
MACSIWFFVPYGCALRAIKTLGPACFLLEEVLISLYTPVGIAGGNLLLLFNDYAFDSVPLTVKAAKALGLTTR